MGVTPTPLRGPRGKLQLLQVEHLEWFPGNAGYVADITNNGGGVIQGVDITQTCTTCSEGERLASTPAICWRNGSGDSWGHVSSWHKAIFRNVAHTGCVLGAALLKV